MNVTCIHLHIRTKVNKEVNDFIICGGSESSVMFELQDNVDDIALQNDESRKLFGEFQCNMLDNFDDDSQQYVCICFAIYEFQI